MPFWSLSYPACNTHTPSIVTCGLSDSNIFFHIRRHDFWKSVFWFSLQILCENFLILIGIQWNFIAGLHVEQVLFLSYFDETWIFWTDFLKMSEYQFSLKSLHWKLSCPMRMDGRTWAYGNFANALDNQLHVSTLKKLSSGCMWELQRYD